MPSTADKIAIATTASSAVVGTTGAVITGLGFTSSGIAAGTVATGMQAGIGNVVAGSAFATIQSLGAAGTVAVLGPVGVVGVLAGGAYFGVKYLI